MPYPDAWDRETDPLDGKETGRVEAALAMYRIATALGFDMAADALLDSARDELDDIAVFGEDADNALEWLEPKLNNAIGVLKFELDMDMARQEKAAKAAAALKAMKDAA